MRLLSLNILFGGQVFNLFVTVTLSAAARKKLDIVYDASCKINNVQNFQFAWMGASFIAEAHLCWQPYNNPYQAIMEDCLGALTVRDETMHTPFRNNILRINGVFRDDDTWSPPAGSILHVVCDEINLANYFFTAALPPLKCRQDPGVKAYTTSARRKTNRVQYTAYYMILCGSFFDTKTMWNVDDEAMTTRPEWKADIAPWIGTQEYIILKELYKTQRLAVPICNRDPEVTSPEGVTELAREADTLRMGTGARQNGMCFFFFFLL